VKRGFNLTKGLYLETRRRRRRRRRRVERRQQWLRLSFGFGLVKKVHNIAVPKDWA
jgi:hypothetical protein